MKINFDEFPVYKGIDRKLCIVSNVKKEFADAIYNRASGIEAHALALKIYNSNGDTEYSDEECALIRMFSQLCSPSFIDSVEAILQ